LALRISAGDAAATIGLTMSTEVRLARSKEELLQLFRFRYAIYVEEMGRKPRHADHSSQTIEEPLDSTGYNMIALEDGQIVGALRANIGTETDFGEYGELYEMGRAGAWFPEHVSMTSKFMVATQHRGGTVAVRLALACFEFGCLQDIFFDFMDTNRHLEATYQRLGYHAYKGRCVHPDYGDVLPMVLSLTDEQHLMSVHSPYLRVRRRFPWAKPPVMFPNEQGHPQPNHESMNGIPSESRAGARAGDLQSLSSRSDQDVVSVDKVGTVNYFRLHKP
jgi:hypothetical protein